MTEECTHDCSSCAVAGCGDRSASPEDLIAKTNPVTTIKNVIGVVSGKGGVGKTFVTCMLANEMRNKGYTVGILDADVTGPSVPKAYGLNEKLHADKMGIFPAETENGIKVMSTNLMLPKDDIPVAWRGPVITGIIRQFWSDVNWGELDYLFIDMPPGTSDVFMTVFQQLPVDAIVTVSTPQELVAMIVGKAVNLAHDLDVPVVGLVENMAYFRCPTCSDAHFIFGDPQGEIVAANYGIPAHVTLPIDPVCARMSDMGRIGLYQVDGDLTPIVEQIENAVVCAA